MVTDIHKFTLTVDYTKNTEVDVKGVMNLSVK